MGHETEAACLLKAGAAYGRRLGLRGEDGSVVFAGVKPGAFSLYFDDEPIYHFDLEGRWGRAFRGGTHSLKGLDGTVSAIDRERPAENLLLSRRRLPFAEAGDLDDAIRRAAVELLAGLAEGRRTPVFPPDPSAALGEDELRGLLDRVAGWDADAWFRHRERYASTYGLLPFLPPEAQHAATLQATLGHPAGIGFAGTDLGPHYIRDRAEFAEHCRDVRRLLGRRVGACRVVYLAGPDVLRLPPPEVLGYLEEIRAVFPIGSSARPARMKDWTEAGHRLDGVVAFLDDLGSADIWPAHLSDPAFWASYAGLGGRRVGIGLLGDPSRKPAAGPDPFAMAAPVIRAVHEAGVGVSLFLAAGTGGEEGAADFEAAVADGIGWLGLAAPDLVYLLDLDEVGGESARDRLRGSGLSPLDRRAIAAQQAGLVGRLGPILAPKKVKVLPYTLAKQWA